MDHNLAVESDEAANTIFQDSNDVIFVRVSRCPDEISKRSVRGCSFECLFGRLQAQNFSIY